MKKNMNLWKCKIAVMAIATLVGTAHASVNVAQQAGTVETTFDSQISATDLINIGQPSFFSATNSVVPAVGLPFSINGTHDGATACYGDDPVGGAAKNTWYDNPTVLTFTLNTDVGTGGSATGYDINGVNVFTGWDYADAFQSQQWTFRVATVANPTFTDVHAVKYQAPDGSKSSLVSLTDSDGVIVSGVTAVQFDVQKLASLGIVFREIDVIGAPSAPDQTAPMIASLSPADNVTEVVLGDNLMATFSEFIAIGTGNITLKNLDAPAEIIIPVGDSQIAVSGTVLTINPVTNLAPNTRYAIRIDEAAIKDLDGNAFAGIADDTTWNFTTGSLIVVTAASATETAFDSQISATDLINIGQPSYFSATNSVAAATAPFFTIDGTHDGAAASWVTDPTGATAKNTWYPDPTTLTFNLNTNAGTQGSATGYDITVVNIFAGWQDADIFEGQDWTFRVATIANPTFTDVHAVKYTPATGSKSSMVALTDSSGVIASGVTAVQFDVRKLSSMGIVFREIDVKGVPTGDEIAPMIVSLIPADNATEVAPGGNLVATFNEAITIGSGNVTLKNLDASTETVIAVADAQISVSGAVLTINPSAGLDPNTHYAIQIDATAIEDFFGNPFAGIADDAAWDFTTGEIDLTAPTIAALSPAANAAGVPAAADLIATFSENIALGTGTITLKNLSHSTQTVITLPDARVSISGAVLTINPSANLDSASTYSVWIDSGAIADLSGNPFAGIGDDAIWSFATAAAPRRIMCVGDSITAGYTDNPNWNVPFQFGYRSGLYTRLLHAGYAFQYVGASAEPWNGAFGNPTNTPSPDLRTVSQDQHRGYGGWGTSGILSNIAAWLAADDPDVVLLMIGINDGGSVAARNNLNSIVETIVTHKPNASVIVAQITPMANFSQSIVDYNTYIRETLVPAYQAQGKRVSTVNQYANLLTGGSIDPTLFSNGINHPNAVVYDRMAQTWLGGIQAAEYVRWSANYPGFDLTDPAADADGDGLTNQQEFAFGQDPTSGASRNPISVPLDPASGTFSYTRGAASGLTYAVWTSPDLQTWTRDAGATQAPGISVSGVQTMAVKLTATPVDGRLFVRITAE